MRDSFELGYRGEDEQNENRREKTNEDYLWTVPRAPNQDKVVNSSGEDLLMWCRGAELWILNGRVLPNTWMHFKKQGTSNCDTQAGSRWVLDSASGAEIVGPL